MKNANELTTEEYSALSLEEKFECGGLNALLPEQQAEVDHINSLTEEEFWGYMGL